MKPFITASRSKVKLFYAGGLRVFGASKVGTHPLFKGLIERPPDGYELTELGENVKRQPAWTSKLVEVARLFRLIGSILKLVLSAARNGATFSNIIRFIKTRGVRSQLKIPAETELVFLPSWPYTCGQIPWVIEFEDLTNLFTPLEPHGGQDPRLFGSSGIYDGPFFPMVKALIESDNCRGVIAHVKSTADTVPVLFGNKALAKKVWHVPLGIPLPALPVEGRKRDGETIQILFTNSWHQGPTNFYLRGGIDVLEAFSVLCLRHSNLRLILRTRLPDDLPKRYLDMVVNNWAIKVVDHFLPAEGLEDILWNSDIFVLPAARLHVVSILEAMAHGLALVTSDGWGINEYVEHGRTGMIVRGRFGKCSWTDERGLLREDYRSMFSPDPSVVSQLVDVISKLVEDKQLREKLRENARADIESKFSAENWVAGLKKAFDQALKN